MTHLICPKTLKVAQKGQILTNSVPLDSQSDFAAKYWRNVGGIYFRMLQSGKRQITVGKIRNPNFSFFFGSFYFLATESQVIRIGTSVPPARIGEGPPIIRMGTSVPPARIGEGPRAPRWVRFDAGHEYNDDLRTIHK